jgi:hypothetical protein
LTQLGIEGQWLLDDLDPQGRSVVLHAVPAIVRPLLVYGFARRYQRQALARWQADPVEAGSGRR